MQQSRNPVTKTSIEQHGQPKLDARDARGTLAWLSVVRAYNQCDAALGRRLVRSGLKVSEHEILVNLARMPGVSQQRLAMQCFVPKSGVSMLVGQMEKRGLLIRLVDPNDARVRLVHLTKKGQRLAEQSIKIQFELVSEMAKVLSDKELTLIRDAMQKVSAVLESTIDPPKHSRSYHL